ncbi:hypothetical protein EBT25_14665 [bacterium]|nr:hypothetical protein [bacterium]
MPTYAFKDNNTNEVFEKFMKMSEKEQFLLDNPHLESVIGAPATVYNNAGKPDQGFRDVLKEIKSKHDAKFTRSTINTW